MVSDLAEKFLTDIGWDYRDTETSAKLVAEEAQKLINHLNQELRSTHTTLSEMLIIIEQQLTAKTAECERYRAALKEAIRLIDEAGLEDYTLYKQRVNEISQALAGEQP